ncbi:ribonuclease R [Mytilus galloprovincialis]|uniref:Ribonuclease R n=1 Tax=Mytilus galloprovincialis TaxID=29158 RepID=A0A8B6GGC4_MYTGA|nr:ribonuclease R [Mytilus galloprovincialis]
MGNTGGNYRLPATNGNHANQEDEDSEYVSDSDSDPYYSAYSNTDDEQCDTSIADLTADISMKADQIDEFNDLSEQHDISVADTCFYPDVIEGNDQRSRLSRFIIRIKAAADASLDMDPFANCRRTLHVYLDLNTSLITIAENAIDPGCIVEEPSSISIKISECFLLMEDKEAVHPFLNQIDRIEEEIKRLKDEVVDSDNEYVKDSNYAGIKQQRIKAKQAKDKHKKKKRTRPKSIKEHTVEYFTMSTSWISVDGKKSKSADNILLSNESINSSNAVESIKKPEGHGISDIESDEEFDKMDGDNWIDNYNSSSEDEKDCENETIDYYEQSVNIYETDKETKLDEYQLLKNGIILSNNYLEQHSKWRQKRDIFQYEEFYGIEKLKELRKTNPNKFKMCTVKLEAAHKAVCKNIDSSEKISQIEISGRSKIGKVFDDDEVCVEILMDEREDYERHSQSGLRPFVTVNTSKQNLKVYGQIRGVVKRIHFPNVKHPVFVCMLDESSYHLMIPVSKTIPKLHILKSKSTNDYKIDVYNYDTENEELQHKDLFTIKPGEIKNYIFLVVMICWEDIYPLGAVIKVLNAKRGLHSGSEILRLQHKVPTMYTQDTIGDVNRLLESGKSFLCEKDRTDLTSLEIFTIDPSNAKDLDDALSMEELDDTYRVGVHITDVTFYVEKDSHIDIEAYERATTFYPGKCMNPHNMLPSPLIKMLFSLIPGEVRPSISIFFTFDKKEVLLNTQIRKSYIKSTKQLSYREVQNIILNKETTFPDSLCKQIHGLFYIAKKQRVSRLGSGLFYSPIEKLDEDDDVIDTKEAHYLVEEFMILANITIGEFLLNEYKNCIPLRVQLPPKPEHAKAWLESYECYADLILKLQEIRPSPVLWYDRKLTIDNTPTEKFDKTLLYQHWVWKKLLSAIENNNYAAASQIIGCDELHPFSCLALDEWYEYQEKAEYKCSGEVRDRQDGSHFTLGMFPYTHFTSPIRRYVDIIVHRLLHCALDNKGSCYTRDEVAVMCKYLNEVTNRAKNYQMHCRALRWGHKLFKEPKIVHGFVKTVSENEVSVVIPGYRSLPQSSKTIQLNSLNAVNKPAFKTDTFTGREILELTWKKRLYSFNGYTLTQTKETKQDGYRLNPHSRGFFQKLRKWKVILEDFTSAKSQKDKMKRLKKIFNDERMGDSKENTYKLLVSYQHVTRQNQMSVLSYEKDQLHYRVVSLL